MTDNTAQATIRLPEQLTIANVAEVKKQAEEPVQATGGVVFDLSDLTNIDTAGVQLLLAMAQHCKGAGKAVSCTGLQSGVANFIEGIGVEPAQLGC